MVLQRRMPISNYRKYSPNQVPSKKEVIRVRSSKPVNRDRGECLSSSSSAVDVIDLGAPRNLRRVSPAPPPAPRLRAPYTPNPRLYPGPAAKPKARRRRKRKAGGGRRAVSRRPVPNARLYRPAPRRVPPAPVPRAAWTPPPPAARALDTASRAALRLAGRAPPPSPIRVAPPPSPTLAPAPGPAPAPAPPSRRLVVTLPAAAMEPGARHSASPDDCSDAADAASAPSEFLAEFLSAIMRRQYAEALKFCRLILQYEPHNATARGFYPLLRHKVRAHEGGLGEAGGSLSGSSAAPHSRSSSRTRSHSRSHSRSDSRSRHGGKWSLSLSRSRGASSAGSEAGGSASSQSSLELDDDAATDDNGNHTTHTRHATTDDLENDNDVSSFKSETASLRRLRAQFACSIK